MSSRCLWHCEAGSGARRRGGETAGRGSREGSFCRGSVARSTPVRRMMRTVIYRTGVSLRASVFARGLCLSPPVRAGGGYHGGTSSGRSKSMACSGMTQGRASGGVGASQRQFAVDARSVDQLAIHQVMM